jgi:hypothetical protein
MRVNEIVLITLTANFPLKQPINNIFHPFILSRLIFGKIRGHAIFCRVRIGAINTISQTGLAQSPGTTADFDSSLKLILQPIWRYHTALALPDLRRDSFINLLIQ